MNLSKEVRIQIVENRIQKMVGTEKNFKCPGVLRKCRRELRNLKKDN